jgi:hypothetical protein
MSKVHWRPLRRMGLAVCCIAVGLGLAVDLVWAASGRQRAPPGSFPGAPAQYTQFTPWELSGGFLALAFGSDLRLGSKLQLIHRFEQPMQAYVVAGGSVDRSTTYRRILDEFRREFPFVHMSVTDDFKTANLVARLIDEKDLSATLRATFGPQTADAVIGKTNPKCVTSVKSTLDGHIVHVESLVVVDQGDKVFLDCAYHEMLHALGLPNHDSSNPWTALNQERTVGYLSVYDRAMVRMLYDPRVVPGMTKAEVAKVARQIAKEISGRR